MSDKFQPGDLAIIVDTIRCPEDLGRIVKIIRLVYPGETMPEWSLGAPKMSGDRPLWMVDLGECKTLKRTEHLMRLNGDTDQFKREMVENSKDQAMRLSQSIAR